MYQLSCRGEVPTRVEPTRVLIADRYTIYRLGIRNVLAAEADIEVVGEASSVKQAAVLVRIIATDVLLLDSDTVAAGDYALVQAMRRELPRTRIILLTVHDAEKQLSQAVSIGASALFYKGLKPGQLVACIRYVAAGHHLIERELSNAILHSLER